MDRTRARELLREHEAELDALERQMADLKERTNATRNIVEGYRTLAGVAPEKSKASTRKGRRSPSAGPGLKRVLENLLRERRALSIDKAMDLLADLPAYSDAVPSRNTVGSRLGDLVRENKAKSDGSGNYEWLESSNGSDPLPAIEHHGGSR